MYVPLQRSSLLFLSHTFLSSQYSFFFSVAYFHPSFFFAAFAVSSRILLVIRETLFRPLRSHLPSRASVFLTSWSTASSPPSSLSRPVLPHPPASAVRDTSSRMSKGDEMRRLVGFHGDQPACTGISRLNRRRLSRRSAPRRALALALAHALASPRESTRHDTTVTGETEPYAWNPALLNFIGRRHRREDGVRLFSTGSYSLPPRPPP